MTEFAPKIIRLYDDYWIACCRTPEEEYCRAFSTREGADEYIKARNGVLEVIHEIQARVQRQIAAGEIVIEGTLIVPER